VSTLNPLLGFPIFSDVGVLHAPTISDGSWLAALPEENVQDRRLHLVARSTNDDATSTQMEFDLGVARDIRVLAAFIPNVSLSGATIRWRGSNTAGSFGSPLFDSTAIAAFPSGETAESTEGLNVWSGAGAGCYVIPTAAVSARYVLMEIVDTANADGYVDVARVAICGGLQLTNVGVSIGARTGFESESQRHYTEGGAAVYTERRVRRVFNGTIEHALATEVYDKIIAMQHKGGISRQFFFVEDPDDTTRGWRRNFLATLRDLSPLEWSMYDRMHVPLAVIEEL
jgi:hypothetical protein